MAHSPKPFFRNARNAWYVQLGAQQIKLYPGPKSTESEREAWKRFHALMAEQADSGVKPATASRSSDESTVARVFDSYLDWCQKHRSPRTYAGHVWHLQRFCNHLKTAATMSAESLKPFHVVEWLDAHPGWGPTYRRNAIAAVQRAFNWAVELGYIDASPVRRVKKPTPKRREQFITPADWVRIRDSYSPGDPFRTLLEFAWETGCRPQEARHLESRHVHLDRAVIAIPPEEAKGKKKWRLIRLEGRSREIAAERLAAGSVKLFVNQDGRPWTSYAVGCRFGRLKQKLGVRYSAYAFRHGFANRLLLKGVDHLTVAELLGHVDGTMLAKVYQHLGQSDAHLRAALHQGSGEAKVTEG